jgi:hypothetical protein
MVICDCVTGPGTVESKIYVDDEKGFHVDCGQLTIALRLEVQFMSEESHSLGATFYKNIVVAGWQKTSDDIRFGTGASTRIRRQNKKLPD